MTQERARILLVDDEPIIRRLAANAFRTEGLDCECVEDARDALQSYRSMPCDLVVVDLRLPGKNGHLLTTELLREEVVPKIVVLTAVCEPKLVKDLYARGVDDIVFKPINFAAFATKIKVILERHLQDVAKASASRETVKQDSDALVTIREIESRLKLLQRNDTEFLQWLSLIDPNKLGESGLAQEFFDPSYQDPSFALETMAHSLSVKIPLIGEERRETPRLPHIITMIAAEVNGVGHVVSKPFKLLARTFSLDGIGILHERPINAQFLGIAWESTAGECMTALVEILRCEDKGGYFDIGGRFVARNSPANDKPAPVGAVER